MRPGYLGDLEDFWFGDLDKSKADSLVTIPEEEIYDLKIDLSKIPEGEDIVDIRVARPMNVRLLT